MGFRFTLLLLSLPGIAAAQQSRFLSLNELFRLGSENSMRLNASRIQENIAGEQVRDAQAGRLPNIQVGATAGYLGQPVVFRQGLAKPTRPENPDWLHNYNLSIVQPVWQGGRIRYGIERAELQRQIAALATADDEAAVKMILLRQYLDLFSLYKQKEVFARNIEEAERRLADIRQMKIEGIVTLNDEIRSELELTDFRLNFRETEDRIGLVSQQLDILLGLDETLLLAPDTTLLSSAFVLSDYENYVDQAYAAYPGMRIARQNTKLARKDISIAKSAYLPSLAIEGSNTLARPMTSTLTDMFSNSWNVLFSLSYNLSSLYQNRHKVQQARQNVLLGHNREQQVMQQLRMEVRSAYVRHNESLDRVESLQLAVHQAEENYRIVNNRYMNQLSILTDLLDAISIRMQAELRLTTARAETVYTYYELLRACGTL